MNRSRLVELVRERSGEEDVEFVDLLPDRIHYLDRRLRPSRMLRRGTRYLVETVEYPGEWWMGEFTEGRLVVWGSYGSLTEAAGQS